MTAKNKTDLKTDIDDDIKAGIPGGIEASTDNSRRTDFIDSLLNVIETAQQTLAGPIKFLGSLIINAGFFKSMASFSAGSSTGALGLKSIYRMTAITADTTFTIDSADIAKGSPANPLEIVIQDTSGAIVSSGFILTIATEGSETIDGLVFVNIIADFGSVSLFSDGTNLFSSMNGPNFNATTQQSRIKPASMTQISSPAQFPLISAFDGNMRWKPTLSTKYETMGSFLMPLIIMPESTAPAPQAIEIRAANQNDALLFDGSDTPHILGRNNGTLVFRETTLVDVSNGGLGGGTVLFDTVGSSTATTIIGDNLVLIGFKSVGNIVNTLGDLDSFTCVSCAGGLTFRNSTPGLGINMAGVVSLNPFLVTPTSPSFCFMGDYSSVSASIGTIQQSSSASAFCIDEAATGNFDLLGNSFDGVGDFFTAPISVVVAGFSDAVVTIVSFRASTFPGNAATHTEAVFSTFTDLIIGQNFLIAGNVDYNGLQAITGVTSDQLGVEFEIPINTLTGGTSERTQVNAIAHGMVRDQTNTIAGAPNHNGTEQIQIRVDDDNFIIPVLFVAVTGGGTVSSTSKDEDSIDVISRTNGRAANSTVVSEANLSGNALVTDIPAQDARVIINATNWIGDNEVRMSVGSDGVTEYIGTVPNIRIKVDGNITLEPESSSKELSCQMGRYDSSRTTVTFANGTNVINEAGTALVNGDDITFNGNAGTLPAELRTDIIYFVVGQATNSFQVSYTLGGDAIEFSDDGSGTNTYASADMHGAQPSNDIAANNPDTLVPQALIKTNPGDKIFTTVSNNQDAVDITVSKAYYRNFI